MSEELVLFFKHSGAALIGLGFIHFVVLRLCNNLNNVKRALISLIVGIVETIIIVVGILVDNYKLPFFESLWYYAFLIMSILLMIVVPIVNFIIGKSRHQQFRNYHIKIVNEKKTTNLGLHFRNLNLRNSCKPTNSNSCMLSDSPEA